MLSKNYQYGMAVLEILLPIIEFSKVFNDVHFVLDFV